MMANFPGDYMLAFPSYPGDQFEGLKRNLRIADRAMELGKWPRVRLFTSIKRAPIVITHLDITAVRDPHVSDWADTFVETTRHAALAGVGLGPSWGMTALPSVDRP